MTLAAPRYTADGLKAWLAAVPAPIVVPPGDPSTWTCLLCEIRTDLLFRHDDVGRVKLLDTDILRLVLRELGRPVRDDERDALLLATPVPTGLSVVEVFCRLLRHESYWARQRSAIVLGHLGDASVLPDLAGRLTDSDNDARRGAAEGIGLLGSRDGLRHLVAHLGRREDDGSVDAAVVTSLLRLDDWEAVRELAEPIEMDEDRDGHRLLGAILAAEESGEAQGVAELLATDADHTRRAAARYLCTRPEVAAGALEALVAYVESEDDVDNAMVGAEALGRAGEEALEALVDMLEHTNWRTRMVACSAFAYVPDLGEAAVALALKLDDDDTDVQREAGLALLVQGARRTRALARVQAQFTASYRFVERAAQVAHAVPELSSLRRMLGMEPPSRELLVMLQGNSWSDDRARGVSTMLLALAEPDLCAALFEAQAIDSAQNLAVDYRRYAAAALMLTGRAPRRLGALHRILLCHEGSVGSMPKGSVAALVGRGGELATLAATDNDWQVRLDALKLLQLLGGESAEHRELLEHVAEADTDSDCRSQAADMLERRWSSAGLPDQLAQLLAPGRSVDSDARGRLFAQLAGAEPALGMTLARRFMAGNDRSLARAAARIVGSNTTSETAHALVSAAVARLDDGSWVTREAAADLLGAVPVEVMGDLLEEVVEALSVKVEGDADNDVQTAAREALASLGQEVAE